MLTAVENIRTVTVHNAQGEAEPCSQAETWSACVRARVCEAMRWWDTAGPQQTVCSDCAIISHGTANPLKLAHISICVLKNT